MPCYLLSYAMTCITKTRWEYLRGQARFGLTPTEALDLLSYTERLGYWLDQYRAELGRARQEVREARRCDDSEVYADSV